MIQEVLLLMGHQVKWKPRILGQASVRVEQVSFPKRNRDLKVIHLCLSSCQRQTITNDKIIPAIYTFFFKNMDLYQTMIHSSENVPLLVTGNDEFYLLDEQCNQITDIDPVFRIIVEYIN
jgi:hypothetical protein